jgi:hypothetical protein
MNESYNIGAFELVSSEALVEASLTQVDNLHGLYRLASVDSPIIYTQGEKAGWDYQRTGGVVPKGGSRLLWFGVEDRLSYYAGASTLAEARLEKLRPVPDSEVARGGRS